MAYADTIRSKTWSSSDIASLIEGIFVSGYPLTWTSWTPTYGGSGGLTFSSVTTHYAEYIQVGKLVIFLIDCIGTVGGSPAGQNILFSLPVARNSSDYRALGNGWAYWGIGNDDGVVCDGNGNTTQGRARRVVSADWPSGSGIEFGAIGFYRAA